MAHSSSTNQFVLDEVDELDQEPGEEEIREYAEIIGIDADNEPDLLWIARAGITAPLPEDWKPVQMNDGELYFYNFTTNESSWEHPSDERYRQMVKEERKNLQLQHTFKKMRPNSNRPPSSEGPPKKTTGANLGPGSNPVLPPTRPPSGKLAPIGSSMLQSNTSVVRPGSKLAPLSLGGKQEMKHNPNRTGEKSSQNSVMVMKRPNKQQSIGLGLEPAKTTDDLNSGRPKTSRGTSDRLRTGTGNRPQQPEAPTEDAGPSKLKLGGARFLKSVTSKEEQLVEEPAKLHQAKPEIMSFSPRSNVMYNNSSEEESEISEEIHIGGRNVMLDASHLKSPTQKTRPDSRPTHQARPAQLVKQIETSSVDSKGEILPRDPSNSTVKPSPLPKNAAKEADKPSQRNSEVQTMEMEAANQIRALKERIEREKAAEERSLRTTMEKSLNELKQKIEEEANEELENIKKIKNEEVKKCKLEMENMKQLQAEEENRLREKNEAALEEIKKRHSSAKEALQNTNLEQEVFEKERSAAKERFERELGDLEAEYEGKLLKARREWKDKIEAEQRKHKEETAKIKVEEEVGSGVAELQAQIRDLTDIVATLKGELTEVKDIKSIVGSLKEELSEIVSEVKEAAPQPLSPPAPLATSTPKKQNIGIVTNPKQPGESDTESLVTENSTSSEEDNDVNIAKQFVSSGNGASNESRISDHNLLRTGAPNEDRKELNGEMISESLAKLEKDLKALTTQVSGYTNQAQSDLEKYSYLGSSSFVEDLIDKRWSEFTSHDFTYPVSLRSGFQFQDRKYLGVRIGKRETDEQINQLKIWLKNFENKINK